ncbi:MAG: von Willebrand factor type A domain-containing protein [Planctomycetaceae bacterium]|jgi:Ca-activated chloride channel family protein|nr:von Willebrand factor type A domain-containing protein [Planctomycetaceae bacterium]
MNLTKSDPRLTSFVLGELSETEAHEIQTAIHADPNLQTEIEQIRQTVKEIETAMQNEPLPEKFNTNTNTNINILPKRKNRFFRFAAAFAKTAVILFAITVISVPLVMHKKFGCSLAEKTSALKELRLDSNNKAEVEMETLKRGITRRIEVAPQSTIDIDFVGGVSVENTMKENDQFYANIDNLMNSPQNTVEGIGGQTISDSKKEFGASSVSNAKGKSQRIGGGRERVGFPQDQINRNGYPPSHILGERPAPVLQSRASNISEDTDQKLVWYDGSYNSANNEEYKNTVENEFKPVKVGEFSTFSIDVDTASYSTMRRYLNETGKCPPVDSVRIEEFINYFNYDYAPPANGKPFATYIDVSLCPWESKHLLARIGIKGKEYTMENRPVLNLVFLIDVSGSMSASNRLPLVKRGLTELVEMLQPKDRVAIVTYAGASQVALPSVSGQEKRAILDSINSLGAGGSTAGAAGIKTAYETARKYYDKNAQNRVILCTDGDFNVGETNNKTLETMIGDEAKSGVFLTILGFGMGNYKDERLKTLSMRGNGNYGYIDTPEEARRLLVESLTGTLFAIAKDVKIQVDFNPVKVAGYRLIGYESRKLRDEDFHNDKIDAGEIGAGHTVTALYELVPASELIPGGVDKSRYGDKTPEEQNANTDIPVGDTKSNELMFVKLRYKLPEENKSSLLEYPVPAVSENTSKEITGDSQFAAAVALFGMLLRESRYSGNGTFDDVLELATPNTKNNQYRKEFIELVKKAKELWNHSRQSQ